MNNPDDCPNLPNEPNAQDEKSPSKITTLKTKLAPAKEEKQAESLRRLAKIWDNRASRGLDHLSTVSVAEAIGISQSAAQRHLTGKAKRLGMEHALAYAEVLNVNPNEIIPNIPQMEIDRSPRYAYDSAIYQLCLSAFQGLKGHTGLPEEKKFRIVFELYQFVASRDSLGKVSEKELHDEAVNIAINAN